MLHAILWNWEGGQHRGEGYVFAGASPGGPALDDEMEKN